MHICFKTETSAVLHEEPKYHSIPVSYTMKPDTDSLRDKFQIYLLKLENMKKARKIISTKLKRGLIQYKRVHYTYKDRYQKLSNVCISYPITNIATPLNTYRNTCIIKQTLSGIIIKLTYVSNVQCILLRKYD